MRLTIRSANPKDWEVIQRLNNELFQDNAVYDDYLNIHWPLTSEGEKYYKSALNKKGNQGFIAVTEGRHIGYILGGPKKTDYRTAKTAEIYNMEVSLSYRSQGIGAKLVKAFRAWAREKGYQTLYVNSYWSNEKGKAFYLKQGFTPIDISFEMQV